MPTSSPSIAKRTRKPALALFAAVLLVFVQLAGAAHFHNSGGPRDQAQSEISAGADLCPVCLAAFHAPAAPAPVVTPLAPLFQTSTAASIHTSEVSRVVFQNHFGRAPPASL